MTQTSPLPSSASCWMRVLMPLAAAVLFAASAPAATADATPKPFKLLIFSMTAGFRHGSIAAGIEAVKKLGHDIGFEVDATEDPTHFTVPGLKPYKVVMFLNTTGHILDDTQRKVFTAFIQAGNGFVGVHSATDTEYDWEWYGKLVGAYFAGHPSPQKATVQVVDHAHYATFDLPDTYEHTDEWYNFKNLGTDLHILMKVDEKSYQGGAMGAEHPICWYHDFDGGRAFYTEMGHTNESYTEPLYLKQLLGGILYAAGRTYPHSASKKTP
jgi:type 1 glutamine amidotransferase